MASVKFTFLRHHLDLKVVNSTLGRPVIGIDHFHKWRPIINSFDYIKISLTNLILKLVIQKNFNTETRLVRLI